MWPLLISHLPKQERLVFSLLNPSPELKATSPPKGIVFPPLPRGPTPPLHSHLTHLQSPKVARDQVTPRLWPLHPRRGCPPTSMRYLIAHSLLLACLMSQMTTCPSLRMWMHSDRPHSLRLMNLTPLSAGLPNTSFLIPSSSSLTPIQMFH